MKFVIISVAIVFVVFTVSGCINGTIESPNIAASCQVSLLSKTCMFTNEGGRGSACIDVKVTNKNTQEYLDSITLCSGEIDKYDTLTKDLFFYGDVGTLCLGEDYSGSWDDCEVSVIEHID